MFLFVSISLFMYWFHK